MQSRLSQPHRGTAPLRLSQTARYEAIEEYIFDKLLGEEEMLQKILQQLDKTEGYVSDILSALQSPSTPSHWMIRIHRAPLTFSLKAFCLLNIHKTPA